MDKAGKTIACHWILALESMETQANRILEPLHVLLSPPSITLENDRDCYWLKMASQNVKARPPLAE